MQTPALYNTLRETLVYLEVGGSHTLQAFDLSVAHYDLLRLLSTAQGQRMGVLVDRLLSDNSKMTRMVDQLEARGLAQRRRDEDDRRAMQVYLTPAGAELRTQAVEAHDRYLQQVFGVLSEEQQPIFGELLAQVRWQAQSILEE
ncbi:MarR family transcriptional regulator [bacterium]|nr:MarR family transcriptional regulator [bacterium]